MRRQAGPHRATAARRSSADAPRQGDRSRNSRNRRHEPHPGKAFGGGAQFAVRPPCPAQPRRAIVRSRERRGGALEHPNGLGVITGGVGPPPAFPCRAFRVQTPGELRVLLAEGGGGGFVVVCDDVVRAKVVQRFLGPGTLRKLRNEGTRQRHVPFVVAKLAYSAQVEEARFRQARGPLQIRLQPVTRRRVVLQVEVAFSDPQPASSRSSPLNADRIPTNAALDSAYRRPPKSICARPMSPW